MLPLLIPLSLYIHIPWCLKKCPYCDFNSYPLLATLPEQEYTTALITDLRNDLPKVSQKKISSIFFGGGTPSLFSAQSIERLLTTIDTMLPIDVNAEITLEVNPSTLEQKYLSAYKQAGITRISLGVQSFQDTKLQTLGRIHTTNETKSALEKIHDAAFTSLNIDLMHNLPGQNIDDALFDLQTAISFSPKHISWYELTIEPKTEFGKKLIKQLPEETCTQIQEQGLDLLQQAGFKQYEISAFALPTFECLHNLNYWQFGDYLGIGAGAHSKITNPFTKKIYRSIKQPFPQMYLNRRKSFTIKENILATQQIPVEFMLNVLRLTNGFTKNLFQERTNLSLSSIHAILKKASNMGLLNITPEKIIPTMLGHRFLNDLLQMFME
jgi:oxygen-independent coproporphyrinogen-3 oxidase